MTLYQGLTQHQVSGTTLCSDPALMNNPTLGPDPTINPHPTSPKPSMSLNLTQNPNITPCPNPTPKSSVVWQSSEYSENQCTNVGAAPALWDHNPLLTAVGKLGNVS